MNVCVSFCKEALLNESKQQSVSSLIGDSYDRICANTMGVFMDMRIVTWLVGDLSVNYSGV